MTKILIVDDEQDIREMINLKMKKEGFETETAYDGANFLEKIDIFQPDLVTLDVMMPGLTTKEILEKLNEKSCKPKIILLTVVRFSDEEKKKLMNMGATDYITKPFEFKSLMEVVKRWIVTTVH